MTDSSSYYPLAQVPHYQRVSTSGDDCTGVPIEDLKSAAEMLVQVDIVSLSRCVDIYPIVGAFSVIVKSSRTFVEALLNNNT